MKALHIVLVLLGIAPVALAADWPQFQGPNRDGHSKDTGLLNVWPKAGPKLEWTFKDAGIGYSSPAVVGDRIYLLGGRGKDEYLFALNASTGKEKWKLRIGPVFDFKGNQWGAGPRSTACVADGLVYALSGFGDLVCAETKSGAEVWRMDTKKDLQAEVNPKQLEDNPKLGWGFAWSPLVDGDKLICNPGGPAGSVAALDRKTGRVVWQSKDLKEQASYASPIVAEIGGVRQYIVLHYNGLSGVAAKDGELLWSWEKNPAYGDVVIPTPIYHEGHVWISAGFKPPSCDCIKITMQGGKFKATNVYKRNASRVMKNTVGGSVLVEDHVFGHSDSVGWVCQDFKTGQKVWAEKNVKMGAGSICYAEGHLYCHDEDEGKVALIEASPKGWNEKGRFELPQKAKLRAVSGRNWTPPVIANGCLYLRDQELLFCYKIK
jgi:outer membrane protein assembly factor BamB